MRVLLVEDDYNTANMFMTVLRAEGFACDTSDTGEDAMQLIKLCKYDAILLDLVLPDIDGMEFLRRIRAIKNETPVLILSALNGISEKVRTLGAGADDYIDKSCNNKELIARLQAVIRRAMGYAEAKIQLGRLSINLQTKTVKVDGVPMKLTNKEYAILELLMLKKGHILTKEAFLTHLYDEMSEEPSGKIVDVFICKLRKKLESALGKNDAYIETVWGRGYMLACAESCMKIAAVG